MREFVVSAEQQGVQLGTLQLLAMHEAEALTDGPFDLAKALGIDFFSEDVRFRAVRLEQLPPAKQRTVQTAHAQEVVQSLRGRFVAQL